VILIPFMPASYIRSGKWSIWSVCFVKTNM